VEIMFVAVLSDKPELRERFCKLVGKETGKDDISFYSTSANGHIITLIDPTLYPDKIQPLLYSLSMADYVVLLVDALTPKVGEIMVAINALKLDKGLIVSQAQLPIAGMVLEKYEKVPDMEAAKLKVLAFPAGEIGENPLALVDKTFAVKSVGNVALGVVKSGRLKKHDKLFLLPEKKEIEVRSIQISDADHEEAPAGARFGMAYKGDLLERGVLVPLRNDFQVENIVNGKFVKSPFFKDELKGKIHAYTNMQFVEGNVFENELKLNAPLAFEKGELILVVDASNQKLRIAGVFQSKW
jgi:selenocysteine-specific translation elongation factor